MHAGMRVRVGRWVREAVRGYTGDAREDGDELKCAFCLGGFSNPFLNSMLPISKNESFFVRSMLKKKHAVIVTY